MRRDDSRDQIQAFGRGFAGRLETAVLEDALEALDHSEWWLAITVLAEQLYEYRVTISTDERQRFDELISGAGGDPAHYVFLDRLVPSVDSCG